MTNLTPEPTPYSRIALWFGLGLIGLIIVAGAAFWAYSQPTSDDDAATSSTKQNSNTANVNNTNQLNANQAVNANTNSVNNSVNANTNTAVTPSAWTTATYQRYDHGFALPIPSDWSSESSSMGTYAGHLSSYQSNGESSITVFVGYQNLGTDTLAGYVAKERSNSQRSEENWTLSENRELDNGLVYYTSSKQYEANEYTDAYSYINWYGYIVNNGRVYTVSTSGTADNISPQSDTLLKIFEGFTFVQPKPYVSINPRSEKKNVSPAGGALQIDWLPEEEELNLIEDRGSYDNGGQLFFYTREYYKVGTITSAPYKGDDLILIFNTPEGPAFKRDLYRAAYDSETASYVILEQESDDLQTIYHSFWYDQKATIADLTYPDTIAIPNSKVVLQAEPFSPNRLHGSYTELTAAFADATAGRVEFDEELNCYMITLADGTVHQYHYQLDFVSKFQEREYASESVKMTPGVTWTAGGSNSDEYTYNDPAGCGSSLCHSLYTTEELGGLAALTKVGKTSTGDDVYDFVDRDRKELHDIYDLLYVPEPEVKPTFQAFTKDHPIFFWQDPFGKWLRFKKVEYLPAVECGKPVIYLYPESETKVNVQVTPTGGFTVTDPVYPDGGWNVTATPESQLTDTHGDVYPYLFWEGLGLNYELPEEGFVVAQANIDGFFTDTLARLGLNAKESADFMEYWVPKFTGAPYFFVTFVDQADFDLVAPLKVEPKPDTVIRVFMDYRPLQQPIEVTPQHISTPARTGFTVVEWGGALHY